jgi:hypothetical protein
MVPVLPRGEAIDDMDSDEVVGDELQHIIDEYS